MLRATWAPYTDDVLADWATATWLTLLSCRDLADDDIARTIDEALAGLDTVARLAQLLDLGAQVCWLEDVAEIDALADSIRHGLRARAGRDGA